MHVRRRAHRHAAARRASTCTPGIGGYYLPGTADFDAHRHGRARRQRVVHRRRQHPWADQRRVAAVRHRLHGSHPPDPRPAGNDVSTYPSGVQIQSLGIGKDVGAEPEIRGDDRRRTSPRRSGSRRKMVADGLGVELHRLRARREARRSSRRTDIMLPTLGAARGGRAGGRHRVDVDCDRRATGSSCRSPTSRPLRSASGRAGARRHEDPLVDGRDRRRAADRRDVRVARGIPNWRVDVRCSTCRGR